MSRTGEGLLGDYYPGTPGFKEPTTSRDAANAMKRRADNLRDLVLAAFGQAGFCGMTADEVAAKLNMSPLAIRPRLTELGPKHLDKIELTGERRCNLSGLRANVWRAKT